MRGVEGNPGVPPPRVFLAKSNRVSLAGVEGSVLFPTMQQGPWLPLERLAESRATEEPESDPHWHEKEEVVNYVLQGTATYIDDAGGEHRMSKGMVAVLSSFEPSRHDLIPRAGEATRWVSLVTRLSHPGPGELPLLQIAPAAPRSPTSDRLSWLCIVGGCASAASSVGLEMAHLTFWKPDGLDLRVPLGFRVVAYVLEGAPQIANRSMAPGNGLLAEGPSSCRIDGTAGDQVTFILVPANRDEAEE